MEQIICPNINIKEVKEQFNELVDAVGETAAYAIWNANLGNPIDKTPLGTESLLFKQLLTIFEKDSPKSTSNTGNVYSKLGKKTISGNVIIKSWGELKNATKAITPEGIVSTRIRMSDNHFGNPFTSDSRLQNLIQVKSTKEAVERYINWVITGETGEYVFTGIQPEELESQREWILEKLKSGELKGKPILYYKELGEPSHATALDYLINKYNWENQESISPRNKAIQAKAQIYSEQYLEKNNWLYTKDKIKEPYIYKLYTDTRLDGFTDSQINSTVNTIIYAAFTTSNPIYDENKKIIGFKPIAAIKDIESLNFNGALSQLQHQVNKALSVGDQETADKFEAIINAFTVVGNKNVVDRNGLLFEHIGNKLSSLGIVRKKNAKKDIEDETQDEVIQERENNPLEALKPAYEVDPYAGASATVKLLLSFTPNIRGVNYNEETGKMDVEYNLDPFTGLPTFIPVNELFSQIKAEASDIITYHDESGKMIYEMDEILKKLKAESKYKPSLAIVVDKIQKADEYTKIQFFKVLSGTKLEFTSSFYNMDGEKTTVTVGNPNSLSAESLLLKDWNNIFKSLYSRETLDQHGNTESVKLDDKAISDIIDEYVKVQSLIDDLKLDSNIYEATNALEAVLHRTGIMTTRAGLNRAIDKMGKQYPAANLKAFIKESGFHYLLGSPKHGIGSARNKNLLKTKHKLLEDERSLKYLAKHDAYVRGNLGSDSMLLPSGNTAYGYTNHNMMSRTLAEWKLNNQSLLDYYNGDIWASSSLALGDIITTVNKQQVVNKDKLKELSIAVYMGMKDTNEKIAKESNEVSIGELVLDSLVRLNSGIGFSLANADKKTEYHIKGLPQFNAGVYKNADGMTDLNKVDSKVQHVFTTYLLGELNRIHNTEVNIVNIAKEHQQQYYHFANTPGDNQGNAFKLHLFPGLNKTETNEYGLFTSEGKVLKPTYESLIANTKLQSYLKDTFIQLTKNAMEQAYNEKLITRKYGKIVNVAIPVNLLDKAKAPVYKDGKLLNQDEQIYALFGNYVLNGIVANVEYTKLFTGDPAQYKNIVDFGKRVPAVGASGYNTFLTSNLPKTYNSVVISNVIRKDSRYYSPEFINTYTDIYIEKMVASGRTSITKEQAAKEVEALLKGYKEVNQTDAQAWITFKAYRDRAIMLGKWDEKKDEAYDAIVLWEKSVIKGDTSDTTQKLYNEAVRLSIESGLATQPLKTVHVERKKHPVDGIYTLHYNKQSEGVLNPLTIQETRLADMYRWMKNNNIDHVITNDGKKSGATNIVTIHNSNGKLLDYKDLPAIKREHLQTLDYRYLGLQQDLPTDGVKDKLVASQIKKNILVDIIPNALYEYNGKLITGEQLRKEIHSTEAAISKKGLDQFKREIEYNEEDNTFNEDKLKAVLLKSFVEKGTTDNIIKALKSDLKLESFISLRKLIQNNFFSMLNKKAVKTKALGGSFIQMADFGFADLSKTEKNGIIYLKDVKELAPPEIFKGEDGRYKVKPGQVFIPYSVVKQIPGYQSMSKKELANILNSSGLMEAITYRIPNQDLSSNDHVEIVGVLPESMGDTIIAYSEITTKTGSDFDIDKQFILLPEYEVVNKTIRRVTYDVESSVEDLSVEQLNNKRFDLYKTALNHPYTFIARIKPLDNPYLQERINSLHKETTSTVDLNTFTPSFQIATRVAFQAGKGGVGTTANNLTDHPLLQEVKGSINLPFFRGKLNNGNMDLSSIVDEDGKLISSNISMFLNAFVDIAKDPYITRGNINPITSNVVFLLARAGVSMDWITAFIGQPILKDYARFKTVEDSLFFEAMWEGDEIQNAKTLSIQKYPEFTEEEFQNPSTKLLEDNINSNNPKFQKDILNLFLELDKAARVLSDNVLASKQDVNGATSTLIDGIVQKNKISKLINSEGSETQLNILGFNSKFQGTMLGAYTRNSLDFMLTTTSSKNLGNSKAFQELVLKIGNFINKDLSTNAEVMQNIENELYTYILSKNDYIYKADDKTIENYFYGDYSMAKKLLRYKLGNNTTAKSNAFIQALHFEINGQNKPSFVYFNDSSKLSNVEQDMITSGWRELLSDKNTDKELKQFATDLIKYSYYVSGFNKGLFTFHQYIPIEYTIEGNTNDFITEILREAGEGSEFFTTFVDQFFRHNLENEDLVYTLKKKDKIVTFKDVKYNALIAIQENNNTVIGYNYFKQPEMRRFIRRKLVDDETGDVSYANYALVGYTTKEITDIEGNKLPQRIGLYSRISKLGSNIGGKKIKEYAMGENKVDSALKLNRLSDPLTLSLEEVNKKMDQLKFDNKIENIEPIVTPKFLAGYTSIQAKPKEKESPKVEKPELMIYCSI